MFHFQREACFLLGVINLQKGWEQFIVVRGRGDDVACGGVGEGGLPVSPGLLTFFYTDVDALEYHVDICLPCGLHKVVKLGINGFREFLAIGVFGRAL